MALMYILKALKAFDEVLVRSSVVSGIEQMHYRDSQKYVWNNEMGYAEIVESSIGPDELRDFIGGFDADVAWMYSRIDKIDL